MQMQLKRPYCRRPRLSQLLNYRTLPPTGSRQIQITEVTVTSDLKVPAFSGGKSKLGDFWEMFMSLINQGVEPTNIIYTHTVPVRLKANDCKVKVNAMLDNGSIETFINEEVAGVFGLQESYHPVTLNVLNNEVDTFQSIPLQVIIENLFEEISKVIKVRTCPKKVTGNYKVESWKQIKDRLSHRKEYDFA